VFPDDLRAVMVRDLRAAAREVRSYPDDASLWRELPGIANPGGTLALHLAGNLRHFIGKALAGGAYVRDRDREFGARGLTRAEVAAELDAAAEEVEAAFARIPAEAWGREYPLEVGGRRLPASRFAQHLVSHLGYHLGQLDYHRRVVAPASGMVGAVAIAEL
jgi:hypothetical protein